MTDHEAVGAVCANRRASQYRSSLDTRRSFGRFRGVPEPLRVIPDSHCCFAFNQSSLLGCCPEFCRAWLVGRRLITFTALNLRSVLSRCGPSCGHGRWTFRWVAVTVTDRFAVDAIQELSVLGSVVAALGGSASPVAVSGGSHVLVETYGKYLGSGYSHKLVEYPVFDLRLLKRCLQKVSSSVFGSLDCPSLPVIVSRRKAVRETRERWFSAKTVASSAVDETAPRATVRISDVVEVGDVQYVEEHEKLGLPCCSRSSPEKRKKSDCQ